MTDWRANAAYRIALLYGLVYALTIAALGFAVYFAADSEISRQRDAGIRAEATELIDNFTRKGLDDLQATIALRKAARSTNSFSYALIDPHGRRLAGGLRAARFEPGWHDLPIAAATGSARPGRMLVTVLPGYGRLAVALDNRAVEFVDRTILVLVLIALALAIAAGGVGAILLGGYLQGRLGGMASTAHAIVDGDFSSRVTLSPRGDEFDQLGEALNAMLDRIVDLLENLRQVSSDVAHDLRTPLARLRVEIELAMSDAPGERRDEALERALRQSDELLRLFSAILRISEVEGGAIARGFQPVDVSALAEDLAESYAPAVVDGGRVLDHCVTAGLVVNGDRELIAQAVINLLDNAQRHTPPGTRITVIAEPAGEGVHLVIADTGPGIPEADRERVIRRFVRLEASRTNAGHGLGLNLVSAIASTHKGRLTIGDNWPGMRATLWLPAAR